MAGRLSGGSPWTRDAVAAIPAVDRALIEERIPDGYAITVGCSHRRGDWIVNLVAPDGSTVARVEHQRWIVGGCQSVLYQYERTAA